MITARKLFLYMGSVVIVCFLVLSSVWILTLRERNRAEQFLQDVLKLNPGKSSFVEAQQLAIKYNGIPWYTATNDMNCTFQRCNFRFEFTNKPLTVTRITRFVDLVGWVYVRDGLVVGREIDYARDPFLYSVIEAPVWNEDGTEQRQSEGGLRRLNVDNNGMPSVVQITLDSSTTMDERQRAYSLDLSCLTTVFGCHSPSAMYPRDIKYLGSPYQSHSNAW